MVQINYKELQIEHIVVFKQEDTVFVCAHEHGNGHNGNGKIRLFLVFENGNGRVYTRNGRTDSWEVLESEDAERIRQQVQRATKQGIATYNFNGSSQIAQFRSMGSSP